MFVVTPSLTDKFLLEEILLLRDQYNVKIFVETGTHVGASALIAAKHFEKVITCENHPWYYEKAKENIEKEGAKNIECHFESSVSLFEKIFPLEDRAIVFLDAHADHDFPLLKELEKIAVSKIKPIIIIHDFYVPDENNNPKFQYDTWEGHRIDLDFIYNKLIEIYGQEKFVHYYLPEQQISGVIYITPYE